MKDDGDRELEHQIVARVQSLLPFPVSPDELRTLTNNLVPFVKSHTAKAVLEARIDQMNYVDQRLIGKDASGERVFYDKEAVIAENKLKAHQRVISDAMKVELAALKQGPTNDK